MLKTVRIIKPELLNQLDSVERLVAEQFILEGRWKLEDSIICHTCNDTNECDNKIEGLCSDSGICGSYQERT